MEFRGTKAGLPVPGLPIFAEKFQLRLIVGLPVTKQQTRMDRTVSIRNIMSIIMSGPFYYIHSYKCTVINVHL